jgi:hypothetical protein
MGWVTNATPRSFYARGSDPGTHCIGGWVDLRTRLDGCGKSRPHRDSIPGPSNPQRVAIPTNMSSTCRKNWAGNTTKTAPSTEENKE